MSYQQREELTEEQIFAAAAGDVPGDGESITILQIRALILMIVAHDQRTTGVADALVWYQDLNHPRAKVNYADACTAMSDYYAYVWPRQDERARFRLTTSLLIERVTKIRETRHEQANHVIEGDPDETPEQFVRRKQAELAMVGDGIAPPRAPAHPLERRPDPERMRELIASVAAHTKLPAEVAAVIDPRRHPAREVRCGRCGAGPGDACRDHAGRELGGGKRVHPSRIDAYAVATTPCPTCNAEPGVPCTEARWPVDAHRLRVEDATSRTAGQ